MSQDELIRRSQAGEVEAFNQLVLAHQRHVYNLALRLLSNVGAAEDATQDAFLSANAWAMVCPSSRRWT